MTQQISQNTAPDLTTDSDALWSAYLRTRTREAVAHRAVQAAQDAWETAVAERQTIAAEAQAAHAAHLAAMDRAAVVAAAEGVAFNLPHLFTTDQP